jgi:GAF domain-containing protein/CheY-like chemotaxis protein/anti-sigma regulatory factor (Ser/Thr protein kinase)
MSGSSLPHADLQRRNEELAAVNAIARALASSLDLKEVLTILARQAAQAVAADRCAISLRRDGHLVLVMGQFADGRTDRALWRKFRRVVGSYRIDKDPAHEEAMRTGRPVAIEDTAGSPLVPRHWVEEFGCRSLLVVPLMWKDRAIGTLTLDHTGGPHPWSREEVDLATTIGDQAALAIENARLYEASEARRRSAEALAAVARDLTASLDFGLVGRRIVDSVRQLLAAGAASLFRLEPGTGDLVVAVTSDNVAPLLQGVVFPRGTGAVGLAVKEGRPVASEDVLADPRLAFAPEVGARVEQTNFRAVLAVPLSVSGRVIGALSVGGEPGRVFDDEEIRLVQAFADQAALALSNARLLQETDRRRRAAESLTEVQRVISRSLDPEEVGQQIVDSVFRLLGGRSSTLFRADEASGDLVVVATSGTLRGLFGKNVAFPAGTGAAGIAVSERRPVMSADILADPRVALTPEIKARIEGVPHRAVLAVPLVARDRVVGALSLAGDTGRAFDQEEVRLAQAFADQAALALENARLYGEAQQALADLRAAQERLVQGATMRALGELASGAAHHLNNLLAVVLGRVRLLLAGEQPPGLRRPLQSIERAAADAAEVVRRISRFARTQPIEESEPVDLKAVAGEVLEMTRARWQDAAQARGVRIDATAEGEEVPPVAANATALREALINLVLNAVEALPAGGRIVLRTFREGPWACVAVSDSGVGMSEELKARALDPFFTTKGPRSTGLGLSVAYGILRRHGGELAIESAEGRGTTVTVRLPLLDAPAARVPAARPAVAPASRRRRVLLIEDDDEVRALVAEMLAAGGHEVLQAAGGRQALALLEGGEAVDLVLTDLGMPDMSGWEVVRALGARWPGLPVGMLTGWGDRIEEAAPNRPPVAGILPKPVSPEDLLAFVSRIFHGAR